MRLSDLSLWCVMENAINFVHLDSKKYPKITSWLKKMRQSPHAEFNKKGGYDVYQVYCKYIEKALVAGKFLQ